MWGVRSLSAHSFFSAQTVCVVSMRIYRSVLFVNFMLFFCTSLFFSSLFLLSNAAHYKGLLLASGYFLFHCHAVFHSLSLQDMCFLTQWYFPRRAIYECASLHVNDTFYLNSVLFPIAYLSVFLYIFRCPGRGQRWGSYRRRWRNNISQPIRPVT